MLKEKEYEIWEQRQKDRGINVDLVKQTIKNLKIETPSWGYSDAGTRFKVFKQVGMPRNIFEKLDDAAQVNKYTGICPGVAIHIPWDKSDDYDGLKKYAENLNMKIGAVNPNFFQDNDYLYGSVCNSKKEIRNKAIEHMKECIQIAKAVDSKALSLWFADGTSYAGQGDFRERKHFMEEALSEGYKLLDDDMKMLIEYKLFEPASYHTDIAEWGMSYAFSSKLGDKAKVLVDLGHHALGINIQHIVAFLLDEGKIGGFHFNSKRYGDDDLIVGSSNPYELFLIFNELIAGSLDKETSKTANSISYMIDQNHCIEPKIPAMIRSILNIQNAQAKALLVNREALRQAQIKNDVLAAENELRSAFEIDVEPLLWAVREEMNLNPNPLKAYMESGYEEKKLVRGIGGGSGWSEQA